MTQLVQVDIDHLRLSEDNVRDTTTQAGLESLAWSIASAGVLEPIVVSPPLEDEPPFRIVHFGARRVLAIDLINKDPAKYDTEPIRVLDCIEKEFDNDGERIAAMLIENLQREDIDPIAEAKGYFRLVKDCAFSQSEIAQRIGRNRSHVSKYLSLLSLPELAQDHIAEGNISLERAWQLVKLAAHPDTIEKLIDEETGAVNQWKVEEALTKQENREALDAAAKRIAQSTDLPIVYTGHASKPKSDKPFGAMNRGAIELSQWDGTVPEGTSYVQLFKEPWQHEVAIKYFTDDEKHIDVDAMGFEDRSRFRQEQAKKNPEPETAQDYGDSQVDPELQRRNVEVMNRVREARLEHQLARLTAVAHGKLTLATLVDLVYPDAVDDYENYAVDPFELVKVGRIKLPGVANLDEVDLEELGELVAKWADDKVNHARFVHLVYLVGNKHLPVVEEMLDKAMPAFDEETIEAEIAAAYDIERAAELATESTDSD